MNLDKLESNNARQNSEKMWSSLIAVTHDMIVAQIEQKSDEPNLENELEQKSFFLDMD